MLKVNCFGDTLQNEYLLVGIKLWTFESYGSDLLIFRTYVKQQNVIMNKNFILLLMIMDILPVYRTLAERGKEA